MLYAEKKVRHAEIEAPATELTRIGDALTWMIATVLRFHRLVAALTIVALLAALAFVLFRSPAYTATSQVLLSNLKLMSSRDDSFFAEVQMEPRFLETQLQVIRSERVAYAAIDAINLPKILAERSASWLSMLSWTTAADGELERRAALKSVQRGLVAQQAGLSEVVEIRYTAEDRELAATVVNAIVRAYVAEQEAARFDAAQAGSSWLRERLREVGPRARVLTVATPPKDKSNLRGIAIIALAGIGGLFAGAFIALARGLLDRAVRVPESLSRTAAGQFLGLMSRQDQASGTLARSSAAMDEHALRQIRSTWDALPPRRGARTLGIVSTHRGEGRSHVAYELARSLTAAGRKTLLVCADPLGASHPDDGEPGLAQWCRGEAKAIGELIKLGGEGGTDYLPAGSGEIDWGGSIDRLLEALKDRYEHVVFDLPPLAMSAEVRRATAAIDEFLLVAGWGMVRPEHVGAALANLGSVRDKLIGFVLNGVDLEAARWMPSIELDLLREQGATVLDRRWPGQASANPVHYLTDPAALRRLVRDHWARLRAMPGRLRLRSAR